MAPLSIQGWPGGEASLRLGIFAGCFLVLALAEGLAPSRRRTLRRAQRWPGNLGLSLLDSLVVRFLAPAGAVGISLFAESRHLGVLPLSGLPPVARVILSLGLLDLVIYLQHRLFHAVPLIWRLHRMHHTDLDLDVTSGARFHPLEILLSLGIKAGAILALGAPPIAVLMFEIVLNATALFNHSNLHIPARLEPWLRCLLVTPAMHRIHHSIRPEETDTNFGFNLPWWDRLLGTYRQDPAGGEEGLSLGLPEFRDATESRIDRLLTQPFRTPPTVEEDPPKSGPS